MRQLEHVMDSAAEYPQVLFRESAFQEEQSFVSDDSLEVTETTALSL